MGTGIAIVAATVAKIPVSDHYLNDIAIKNLRIIVKSWFHK